MATRTQAKKKSLLQVLALIIAVVIVLAAFYLFREWWTSRPGKAPSEITVTATVGDSSTEVSPYLVCELGDEDCPEGEAASVPVGEDQSITIEVPSEISDQDWQAVMIYDDPAANDQLIHGPKEASSVTVPGSVDPLEDGGARPRLIVVEISSLLLGTGDDGEEAPVSAVWSINAES